MNSSRRRGVAVALCAWALAAPVGAHPLRTSAGALHAAGSAGDPSQTPDDTLTRGETLAIDSIFSRWSHSTTPGCAVGIGRDGILVFERAYGMANLEHGIANAPGTIFEGGSVSKQFAATAIVLLALDGRLSLDDDVRKHVPELPDYGERITLRRLMTHTSGLRDWGSVAQISGWGREQRSHDHDWVLDILSRQRELNFSPGAQYSYSNSGYNLLAIIAARVSGVPFAEFSEERIFEPLGLDDTQWRDDYRRIVPRRSTGYAPAGRGWRIRHPIEFVHGNGGILTTVADLVAWTHAISTGEGLGGAEFVAAIHQRGVLNDGSAIPYAGGLVHGNLGGVPSVSHTGSTAGYTAYLGRYLPESAAYLTVAMLCNAANVPTGGTGNLIARALLGEEVRDPESPVAYPLVPEALDRYEGLYRNPVTGAVKRLRVFRGMLREGGVQLLPLAADRFSVGGGPRHYVFGAPQEDADGRPAITVDSWEYTDERFEPVEDWVPAAAEQAEFQGRYESDEAETLLEIALAEGRLVMTRRPGRAFPLAPVYPDAFQSAAGMVRFRRDEDGRVTALSLSSSRVFDIRFAKVAS